MRKKNVKNFDIAININICFFYFQSLNSRYENADILEIAVNLISSNRDENLLTEKTFENGFGYCRDETLKFLQNIETRQSNRIKNVLQKCLNSGGVEESEQITYENENNLNIEMEEEQIVLRDFVHNEEFIEPLRNRVVLDKLRNKIFEKRRQRRAFQRVQMNNGENMWRPW